MRTKLTYIIVFLIGLVFTSSFTETDVLVKEKFIVVLDAGHGGHDPGKQTKSGLREKDIALKITLDVGRKLEKNKEIKVIYTRNKDEFIDLEERGAIANRAKADLFVSIHCNAHSSQANGAETYVLGLHRNQTNFEVAKSENSVIFMESNYEEKYSQYDVNSPESVIGLTLMQEEYLEQSIYLASLIQDNFRQKLKRNDRSVKQAGFIVLHQTVMPSVLVETGFITNTSEGKFLSSSSGQQAIANSIAEAVVDYEEHMGIKDLIGITSTEPVAEVKDIIYKDVTFRVQLAASGNNIATKPYNFKGLREVTKSKEGKLYKYYYGGTSNYTDITKKLEEAKTKGFTSAYIVSFKNGIKTPVDHILN
ncbi:MAG: N-acetylmuramoyl-L-alanine amidase [Leeuwenhoekiella sp.]